MLVLVFLVRVRLLGGPLLVAKERLHEQTCFFFRDKRGDEGFEGF